jgi:hypothetical protein
VGPIDPRRREVENSGAAACARASLELAHALLTPVIMTAAKVIIAAALALGSSGCALTRWTDRQFLGTTGGAPVHEGRMVTGLILVPVALVGDLVTFPVQAVVLVVAGDDALLPPPKRRPADFGRAVDARALASLQAIQTQMTGPSARVYGVDAEGHVLPLALDRERVETLVARTAEAGATSSVE